MLLAGGVMRRYLGRTRIGDPVLSRLFHVSSNPVQNVAFSSRHFTRGCRVEHRITSSADLWSIGAGGIQSTGSISMVTLFELAGDNLYKLVTSVHFRRYCSLIAGFAPGGGLSFPFLSRVFGPCHG